MASITRYKDGWRVFVYEQGQRATKVCRTHREAKEWGDAKEAELTGGTSITFAAAAERWLAWKLPQLDNANNVRTVDQSIREHVLPAIGDRKLSELKRADLVAVVRKVATAGKVETAHRLGQRIRAIFDHAVDHGDIETHPAAGLSRVLPVAPKRPQFAVVPEELPALLKAIAGYSEPVTRLGLQLLAHTFVRTSELIGAQWTEIRGDVWVIPEARMKRRIPHVVPLSEPVRAILAELRAITGEESAYILASRNCLLPISNNTLLFALYRLGYRGRMTGHGFRALASTILNESGLWSRDCIERQLAHRESDQVRASYMRAEFLTERVKMMHWWSSHLLSL